MKFDINSLILSFSQIVTSISKFPYTRYIIIALAVFLLLFVFGKERHLIFHSHKKGAVFGFFFGILLMIVIDAVLVLGMADRTKLQNLVTGKEQRKALVEDIVISGLNNLNKVLGTSAIVAGPKVNKAEEVVGSFMRLPADEANRARDLLCPK